MSSGRIIIKKNLNSGPLSQVWIYHNMSFILNDGLIKYVSQHTATTLHYNESRIMNRGNKTGVTKDSIPAYIWSVTSSYISIRSLFIHSCATTLMGLKRRRELGGKKVNSSTPQTVSLCFFVCENSLTLWFFHSFLLIPVLAPQFYPRCIASKERKTERESESWLKKKACMGDEHW